MSYEITNQQQMRRAFWAENPQADRKKIKSYSGKGLMYCADTRTEFSFWLDSACRDGRISPELAERATLQPAKAVFSWELQKDYGYGDGWECLCSEPSRMLAIQRKREYQENEGGEFRIRRTRELIPQGGGNKRENTMARF